MNKFITNILVLFLIFLFALIATGFILHIDHYEQNYIIKNDHIEKIHLSLSSYESILPRIQNNQFEYYESGIFKVQKILNKIQHSSYWEIWLDSNDPNRFQLYTPINYFLNQQIYWSIIFS